MEEQQPGNLQPGQVVSPRGSGSPAQPGGDIPQPEERPTEQPEPVPNPAPSPEPASAPASFYEPASEPDNGWQFSEEPGPSGAPASLPETITWTASEYIAHEKSGGWYGLLALGGLVATALVYLLTKDKISTGIILLAVVAFGLYAGRKPRTQNYGINNTGFQIGQKMYAFHDFKAFSVAEEGAIASIVLLPLKRFMPPLTVYVSPDMEEQVVDFLGAILPLEQHKADAVDSLLRRIHF